MHIYIHIYICINTHTHMQVSKRSFWCKWMVWEGMQMSVCCLLAPPTGERGRNAVNLSHEYTHIHTNNHTHTHTHTHTHLKTSSTRTANNKIGLTLALSHARVPTYTKTHIKNLKTHSIAPTITTQAARARRSCAQTNGKTALYSAARSGGAM